MNEDFSAPEGTPKTNFPDISSLQMSASELHEMFLALTWSGFSERQCLYIIGVAISGGMLSPYKHVSDEDEDEDGDDFDLEEDDDFDGQGA
jgi:hypothetical protein